MAPFRSRRQRFYSARPLIGFLLIASFGILFVGCGGGNTDEEEFAFTADDLAAFTDLSQDDTGSGSLDGSGSTMPYLLPLPSGSGAQEIVDIVLDLTKVPQYRAIRAGQQTGEKNVYRVTNEFVNVRSEPKSQSASIGRFNRGEAIIVTAFPDASWAEVQMPGGVKGYVALRYIARATSDEKLAEEKRQFDGKYYVNFAYVNVRSSPDQSSPKIGEIPGQAIVQPTGIQNGWAAVPFEGKTGYISADYLAAFLPTFQVRQERYELPILHYRLGQDDEALLKALPSHITALRAEGYSFMTLDDFAALLTQQEQRDVRLQPKTAVIAVSGVTNANVQAVSDTLNAAGVDATIFIESSQLGLSGITEKTLLNLAANGFDLGSAGHTGDDFRALTNAQATLELQQSRKLLEERGKTTINAIAYPQGGVNDRIEQLTAEAGYLFGLGGGSSRSFTRAEFLRLPGILMFPTMTAEDVVSLTTGQ